MQDHLKQRLTGAAILVIAVVLLVPELFHGRTSANSHTDSGSAAGPPVRSYTIDLRDNAATQQPAAMSPPVATMPAPPAPNSAAEVVAAPIATAPAPAPATVPAAALSVAPAAAAVTAPPTQHGNDLKSGWVVQVGSFSRRDFADRMVKDLAAKGFTVEVAGPDDHGLYRVRSAPRAERAAALALKQKLQVSGLKPIVNRVP